METDTEFNNIGGLEWPMALALMIAWIIVFAALIKGVASLGLSKLYK